MSRGRSVSQLHERLTVAWVDAGQRASLSGALAATGLRIDRGLLEERATEAAERRREAETVTDAALDEEVRAIDARRASAELALEDLVAERRRLRDAAEWCARQPERVAEVEHEIAAARAALDEHSRVARESTRQLERVLEQRAAAEAALEEARRELSGLGATGVDESDVRRQMEAASQDLRTATTEYREAMKEVARRRAVVDDLDASNTEVPAVAVPRISDGDQLQAMRQALRLKLDPVSTPSGGVSDRDVERARAELREAEERAEAAADHLATVRRTIDGFETELIARSNGGDARDVRHDAAVALEAQVSSVERQLSEAEGVARAEVDEATRAVSRAELALDRLRQESREHQAKLRELVVLVPAAERPPAEGDLLDHVDTIAAALRALAAPMQEDIEQASEDVGALRAEHDEKAAEQERRRAGRDAVLSEDRAAALRGMLQDPAPFVLLEDIVTVDGLGLSVDDLDVLDASCPLVVLTEDLGVAGWAIELPAERGRLASGAELWATTDPPSDPADHDHHPEPSTSR